MPQDSGWLEERLEVKPLWRALADRLVPKGVGWWYTEGFATLFLLILQIVTGAILTLNYSPTPEYAYDSIQYIMNNVAFGHIIRGIHQWSAWGIVVVMVIHALRAFFFGAYKYPRELTWVLGVFLLLIVLGFSFTGYLLPWDQRAYWATVVGTNMAGTAPYIGDFLLKVVRGGAEVGAVTLARFYSLHIAILPALIIPVVGIHIFMVIRQGISAPPDDR